MYKFIVVSIATALLMMSCGSRGHDPQTCGEDHGTETSGLNHESDISADSGHDHGVEVPQKDQHEDQAPVHAGEIIFTQDQAAQTDFELFDVEPVVFQDIITTSGRIMAAQGDEASVVAPVSGIVSFTNKKITDGMAVGKGETLFTISSKEVAQGDYIARTRVAYEQAKAAFERAEVLVKDQIISQADYEQSRLNYENAKTAYDALAGKTTAQGTRVTTPIGGFIKNVGVGEGAFVEVGQPLATVSQNKRLVLRAEVSQRYLSDLRRVSGANFKTPYDQKVYALEELGGRLLSVGKSSDENSVYVPVIFEFNNSGDVIPGSFVEIFLKSTPQRDVLTVPLSALVEDQGVYYVFVQIDEEGYLKREVKLGANDGKHVQVVSGLQAGERVVSRGVAQVKMASFSGAIPHGHAH